MVICEAILPPMAASCGMLTRKASTAPSMVSQVAAVQLTDQVPSSSAACSMLIQDTVRLETCFSLIPSRIIESTRKQPQVRRALSENGRLHPVLRGILQQLDHRIAERADPQPRLKGKGQFDKRPSAAPSEAGIV